MEEVDWTGCFAAALPSDPWNWVDLDPQPTLMNLSAELAILSYSFMETRRTFSEIFGA